MTQLELLPQEALLIRVRRHWIVLLRPLLLTVGAAALAGLLLSAIGIPALWTRFAIALLAATLFVRVLRAALLWATLEFDLTTLRVILREGVFLRRSKVVSLDRIQDVSTRVGLLGRLVGYGTLEIDAAGRAGSEVIPFVGRPQALRDLVFAQTQAMRESGGGQGL